ncbi:MAG: tRNA pseudouridine(55) synthase TruB [Puniceicoccales bacterium]|jgi:tRNA pseudouridine55 synthase|nr:tRNA pseudouridine(55) synthase TruB [Puniceicoccales bacterium]
MTILQLDSDLNGILLIDKPAGLTSHDVVYRVRRAVGVKRVGHAGTLDPLATGLLVVLIGRATKFSQFLTDLGKSYEGTMQFGVETDSHDAEGNIVAQKDVGGLTLERVREVAAAFGGDIMQTPPMFSAKKLNGKPLYKFARRGETIERRANLITISRFEINNLSASGCSANFVVCCSKGTYIRTLVHDLGQTLGCGAHLSALRRTMVGHFSVTNAHSLAEICAMPCDEIRNFLVESHPVAKSP